MSTELLYQQTEAVSKLERLKVGALLMDPGTGKTRTAIELIRPIRPDYLLWLTPCQTKANLATEISRWGLDVTPDIVGIQTLSSSDREYLRVTAALSSAKKPMIICDESSMIKNLGSIRTKRIMYLSRMAEYKLIMNGTLLTKNVLDAYSQFEFLSPKILKMSFCQFKNTFCEYVQMRGGAYNRIVKEFIVRYHNLDYLYSLIEPYIFYCALNIDIKKQYINYGYSLSDEDKEEYKAIKEEYLSMEKSSYDSDWFLAMTAKMQHSYCCTEDKFIMVNHILKRLDSGRVLLFAKFNRSEEALKKRFPNVRILKLGSHSYGLNLQQYNAIIYFDKTFDYGQRAQSEARIYRTGQPDDCYYYDLTGNVGLEALIDRNIDKKMGMADYLRTHSVEEAIKQL